MHREVKKAGPPDQAARPAAGERGAADIVERPIRVLIVAASLDIMGGQAVQAARLVERLREEPTVRVSFLPINPRLPGPLRVLQRIRYVRTIATSLAYVATLLARVARHDVVHIYSASYFSFVLAPTPAILIARLYGKKVVLDYHSGEAEDHLRRWRRTAVPTLRLADALTAPSDYLVDVFARFGLRARAIFNLIEPGRLRFRERRPLRPVFLSNRNFEPHYNVGCVLRAFALIQRRYPEARLRVVGDGRQRGELARLARALDLRHTEFTGCVALERMREFYDAADIYLNGSNIDNMPLSILEAYAAGLPVVTTDAGGIPYIVADGETGLLVPCEDHEALAAAAVRLLEDEALVSKIISGGRAECRKYDPRVIGDKWIELYRELVERREPHASECHESSEREKVAGREATVSER